MNSSAVVSEMEKIMTMIVVDSKEFPHELVALLTTRVNEDNQVIIISQIFTIIGSLFILRVTFFLQIVSPVCWELGEKVLKNCAARLNKPHLPDMVLFWARL